MVRALCVVIASAIVVSFAVPARAQDAATERKEAPAAAPVETAPAAAPTPATAPAPEQAAPAVAPAPREPVAAPQPSAPAAGSKQPIGGTARARKDAGPDHVRGQITSADGSVIVVRTREGRTLRLGVSNGTTVFSVSRASFADVTFGTYVGSVSEQLGDDIYSPIRRDSLSWLHKGYELRIFDEKLRGLAVGFTKWDLTANSVMTHGWVDDMEDRVLSIKYGPTEEEETDVEVRREVPIHKLSLADKSLLRAGARVFAGAHKGRDGSYTAVFVFVGTEGMSPAM